MVARSLLTALFVLVAVLVPVAVAQGSDTIFDEAGVLGSADEREVQAAFDQVSAESGDPLYAFLVSDTNAEGAERQELLLEKATQAGVPPDAGVILVDTEDRWDLVRVAGDSDQAVHGAMAAHFSDGNFAEGLLAGAAEIQDNLSIVPELLTTGGVLAAVGAIAGGAILLRNRRRKERELEEQRRLAETEFAELTERMGEFDEKERLVGGYLEAQRLLLDQETEERVEALIADARSTGFGQEFNEAAARLASDPTAARARTENGRRLLEGALEKLDLAETTIDEYRAADEALDGKLRAAAEEIESAEVAEDEARAAGVSAQPARLRPEYDRLAREAAERAACRDEFDPRRAVAAVDVLTERARERQTALQDEIAAGSALPEERSSAEYSLARARETLEEYRRAHAEEESRWGPAALEGAPSPEELSSGLRHAAGCIERAARAEASGRFAEARALLEESAALSRDAMQAPRALKAAAAEADRKRREGEEKLKELEARLERAKANEHLMDPYQRQRLREYEYELQNARFGFFGADWLTALLLFEALDHDYVYMDGAPGEAFGEGGWGDGGDWSGGDWGSGDWGGGDFGGGDFGGGGF
jgi:uncharacterized membrane protein YgcG